MIAVLQRVSEGKVTVEDRVTGEIETGLVILLGVAQGDTEADAEFLADRIAGFRIFNDDEGKMNRSIRDVNGEALVISQFTLAGDWRKGRRPSFTSAAPPEEGERLYKYFCEKLTQLKVPVKTGEFGAMMKVSLVNDGPVTFVMDSHQQRISEPKRLAQV
ncbi:MAG: D-aminoacyl-tRNA deacylase [Verrucomicrobiota bacterium]|nr:D-aminoacyl-tRNA deacylase [Verrucomicrobiota bacterium]MDG1833770.1 D-aminoacyl-tRNA deacylase [Verrucomicrobiota bacterium]|tara:strand:+ start:954 stop:1433 length:480 start_codon:yes stop_codon:yes gene_type:complete